MKKVLVAAAALGIGLAGVQAQAEELWNPHLRGVDEGLAAGALPPKGVYFIDNTYLANYKQYTPAGSYNGNNLTALIEAPILLWNPGIKVLGADYSVAVAQPFDYTAFGPSGNQGSHWGTFNTILVPAMLSWSLPYDFHVMPKFSVFLDDASSSFAHPPATGVGAGMANTTFEPALGVSWLHDGWNVSAEFMYDISTADTHSNHPAAAGGEYQSGDQFAADYTVTKTLGKWTVGMGGFQLNQVERDKANGVALAGTVAQSYGLGPIVGYDFGGVNLQAQFNHMVAVHNDVGGDFLNVRAVVPLY